MNKICFTKRISKWSVDCRCKSRSRLKRKMFIHRSTFGRVWALLITRLRLSVVLDYVPICIAIKYNAETTEKCHACTCYGQLWKYCSIESTEGPAWPSFLRARDISTCALGQNNKIILHIIKWQLFDEYVNYKVLNQISIGHNPL